MIGWIVELLTGLDEGDFDYLTKLVNDVLLEGGLAEQEEDVIRSLRDKLGELAV